MKHEIIGNDIRDAVWKAMDYQLNSKEVDTWIGSETSLFNVLIYAKSCTYNFDVGKELYLNIGRWSRLIKEYIDRYSLDLFIEQSKYLYKGNGRDGAVTEMHFKEPKRAELKHRWGGCLIGATFRGEKESKKAKPTLSFFSRTSYIGYMGLLDVAIASLIAREISEGFESTIEFRWYLTTVQYHFFKSLPFMFTQPKLIAKLEAVAEHRNIDGLPPTWRGCCQHYNRICNNFNEHGAEMCKYEKYGPYKRVKRRFLQHHGWMDTHTTLITCT